MKIKLDTEGHAVLEDGKPVYVSDDGSEAPVDVAAMQTALGRANQQAADQRGKLAAAEASLKLFKGLDPQKAKEALAFREALGEDVDASKVTTEIASLKAERAGLVSQVEDLQGKVATADKAIDGLTYDAQIRGSEFVGSKVAPALRDPKLFRAAYDGSLVRDEHGNLTVRDAAGNTIMSESTPGQPATLDEALPKIVTNPHHLAAGNASGGGEKGGGNGAAGSTQKKKVEDMTRAEQIAYVNENPDAVQEMFGR